MTDHKSDGMSESEEMYLVTLAGLVESGAEEPVPLSLLAQEMAILPVSVNQMIHKLAREELVNYLPYRGAELTAKGREIAFKILRNRRLWELFLVSRLGLGTVEADELACRLEHITPEQTVERLDEFLGRPRSSPQGLPIPQLRDPGGPAISVTLPHLLVGQSATVIEINASHGQQEAITEAFLESEGVRPGTIIRVLAVGNDGALLLESGGRHIHLTKEVAEGIAVRPQEAAAAARKVSKLTRR